MTNTLRVQAVKTETTPGEFVTDAYEVVPVEGEAVGPHVYVSRFANKAFIKAGMLTVTEQFAGYTVAIADSEVATEIGKQNLELLAAKMQWEHVKLHAKQELPVEEVVAFHQTTAGEQVAAYQAVAADIDSEAEGDQPEV